MPSVKEIYHKIDDVRIEADTINLNVDGLEALASTQQADVAAIKADLADGITVSSSTLPTGAATSANQATANASLSNIDTDIGATSESPAGSDTATSGINGLLKRLLQRITALIYPPFSSGSFDNSGGTSSAIDCAGYDYLVQHVYGGGGGYTRPIQWSNDGTNWTSSGPALGTYYYYGSNSGWETLQGNMGTNSGLFVFPVLGRYWRITTGGTGGGSWTHRWYLHRGPLAGILEDSIGSKISSAAASDTDNTGLIGLFKRLLQRITTLIPANLTVTSTRLLVDGSGVTQPVSGTVTANAGTELGSTGNTHGFIALAVDDTGTATHLVMDGDGNLVVKANVVIGSTGESTVSTFTSTTSATLKADNSSRKLLTIFNEGAGNLHVLYGAGTASTTNYSVRVNAGDYLEIEKYTGEVRAIFATAGTARVTEIVT